MDGKQSQADPTEQCIELWEGTGQLVTAAPWCLGYHTGCPWLLMSVIWG